MFLLVPAYPGSPGQKAVKRLCVCDLYGTAPGCPQRRACGHSWELIQTRRPCCNAANSAKALKATDGTVINQWQSF